MLASGRGRQGPEFLERSGRGAAALGAISHHVLTAGRRRGFRNRFYLSHFELNCLVGPPGDDQVGFNVRVVVQGLEGRPAPLWRAGAGDADDQSLPLHVPSP